MVTKDFLCLNCSVYDCTVAMDEFISGSEVDKDKVEKEILIDENVSIKK